MANSLTGRVWTVDTGSVILSHDLVAVAKIIFWPNAASDIFQLNSYSRHSVISGSRLDNNLATIANTNTMTTDAGSPYSTNIDDGDVLEVLATNGNVANKGRFLCTADATSTVITCAGQLTNESNKLYSIQAYKGNREFYMKCGGSGGTQVPIELDFNDSPRVVPSLIMETLPASGIVVIYIA